MTYDDKFITSDIVPVDPDLLVVNTLPEFTPALEAMQIMCYPTLVDGERFKAAHYLKHIEMFADGQLTALLNGVPVGATTTLRLNMDFDHLDDHTFWEATGKGWLTTHDPHGEWLYGADMMVHPDYRRRGISRQLYAGRQRVVRRYNLRGQVAVGMVPGYHRYAEHMSPGEYMAHVAAGDLTDPTLTSQLRIGFRYVAPVLNYLQDVSSGYASALIVWDNPDYRPGHHRP
jgi:GNAT superfamily N-acetyltransferase